MKKAYHTACKEEKLATSRENNSKMENNNPEAQKKLQDKVEKCQQDVQKVCVCTVYACLLVQACLQICIQDNRADCSLFKGFKKIFYPSVLDPACRG